MQTNSNTNSDERATAEIPPLLVAESADGRALTKRFEPDGTKIDFSGGKYFSYHELVVDTWADLLGCLVMLTEQPTMCVVRGALHPDIPRDDGLQYVRRKRDAADSEATILPAAFPWVVFDFDDTAAPFDLNAPAQSIRAWHSTLPPELRAAQSAFFVSSSSHTSATVRGKLVVWYRAPVSEAQARLLAGYYRADMSVGVCHQPNYFAAPLFEGGAVDPLAALRSAPILFDGKPALLPNRALVKAWRERPAPVPLRQCPPGDRGILAALGPQESHVGRRFWMCGHLGGIMRKLGFAKEDCAGVLRDWLVDLTIDQIEHGVAWALEAWDMRARDVSGEVRLRETVGKAHADVIVKACLRARRPVRIVK